MSAHSSASDNDAVAVRPLLADETLSILRAILAASDHGVLLTDLNHKSLACNRRFGEMFGVDPHRVVRGGVNELRRKVMPIIADPDAWLAGQEELYVDPWKVYEDDLLLKRPGDVVLRRYTGPVFLADGSILGRLWTFRDVTHERHVQHMHEVLHEIGSIHGPDPAITCRRILDSVSAFFDRTTVILSIRNGDRMDFAGIAGPITPLHLIKGNALRDSYCQFALDSAKPLLIQDARREPKYRNLKPTRFGLTRYLGVPLSGDEGNAMGTLCVLDRRSDRPFAEHDSQFLSLVSVRLSAELARERYVRERLEAKESLLRRQTEDLSSIHAVLRAMNRGFAMLSEKPARDWLIHEQARLLPGLLGYCSAALFTENTQDALRGVVAGHRAVRPLAFCPVADSPFDRLTHTPGLHATSTEIEPRLAAMLDAPYMILAGQPEGVPGRCVIALGRKDPAPMADDRHRVMVEALVDQVRLLMGVHQLQEELVEKNTQLSTAQDRLLRSEKLSVVGTLAASTAHDIRNIVQSLSFMTADREDPERALDAVREQLDRFNLLSHRLLSYARPRLVSWQPIDLESVLEHVVGLIQPQARISNVRVVLVTEGSLGIHGDPHQLEHLFVNLTINAVQAMGQAGGSLKIQGKPDAGSVVVAVSDTGPGFPKEIVRRLFEPFASSRADGFGLGLYSCRRIVDSHHGTITLARNSTRGSRIVVRLPSVEPKEGH